MDEVGSNRINDSFFWRAVYCWGWATWKDRWAHFEKDPEGLVRKFDPATIQRFNLDGSYNFWKQVIENIEGRINTWAVFWYATVFQHDGLCLNPYVSYVRNIGFDGSGVHGTVEPHNKRRSPLNISGVFTPPSAVAENQLALKSIKRALTNSQGNLLLRTVRRFYERLPDPIKLPIHSVRRRLLLNTER